MASAEYMLEKENCIICLLTEEESEQIVPNSRCACRYSYHIECMKNITICPICMKAFPYVSVRAPILIGTETVQPLQIQQHQHLDRTESCMFKFVFFTIVVAGLSVIGYFTAISS
jgi:hypothetical protein